MSAAETQETQEREVLTERCLALVSRDGMYRTARRLQITRESLARILAGQPVRRGTIAQVERALERVWGRAG